MSELVNKYLALGKKVFENAEKEDVIDEVRKEAEQLKKQFKESDWDELIASVPLHIRPMVEKQKSKFLDDNKHE